MDDNLIRPIPLCLDLSLALPLIKEDITVYELPELTPDELKNVMIAPPAVFQSAS